MGKVILITSREFIDGRGSQIPIMEDYVSLFFQRNPMDPKKGMAGHLREMDEFWQFFKKGDDCLCICGDGEDSLLDEYSNSDNQFKTRNEHNDLMDESYLSVACDLMLKGGRLTNKGNEIVALIKNEKKPSSQFIPGVFEKSLSGDTIRIFVAEEYPYDNEDRTVFSELKQMYLNALIEMVMNYVCEEVEGDLKNDWLILSHDADWGQPRECSVFKDSLGEINENYPHLKKIVEASTRDSIAKTQIICFQHDRNSNYYNKIKDSLMSGKFYDYFPGLNSNASSFRRYLEGGCYSGLDLTKPYLYAASVPEYFKIEEIQNNGEGIGVFLYDDSSCNNSLLLEILKEDNNRLKLLKLLNHAKEEKKLPMIIKLNLGVFKSLPVSVPGKEDAIRKLEHSLDFCFSFLKSSSIWIRIADVDDSFDLAKEEFNWFKSLLLYDFKSAMEFFDYNVRTQKDNYLEESGGHGAYITPVIYSDEVEYRDSFIKENGNINFKFLKANVDEHCKDFKTENVALRILVVDDKIGKVSADSSQKEIVILNCHEEEIKDGKWRCKECVYPDNNNEPCKLQVIKKLLSGDFISKDKTNTIREKYNRKTYWSDEIRSYCVNALTIKELWKTENENAQNGKEKSILKLNEDKVKQINKDLELVIKKDQDGKEIHYAQIIGVRDLESALAIMSCCKFDIILLDYLLGKRGDTDDERYYSTELFEFLSSDFGKPEIDDLDVIKMLRKNDKIDGDREGLPRVLLEQFRDEVKLNRGPLDKYWIVPMTSYNPSFLSDLQRRNVRLIDHRWNISQGADPINTPWRFLYKLNEFVDLQLRSSVYWKKQLMTFVRYTCEDFKTRFEKIPKKGVSCFEEFQQFMGAEYANYMKRYGARKLIERDAALEGDNSNKSLFATYIARNFYNDPKFSIETELNRLMQSFYHRAATMFNDRHGLQRLRIAFEQMRMFIVYNKLDNEVEDPDRLLSGLCFLHAVIDSEFNYEKISEWLKKQQ